MVLLDHDRVLNYWHKSLVDADLSSLRLTSDNHERLPMNSLQRGKVSGKITEAIFSKLDTRTTGSKDEIETEILVVVAPIIATKGGRRGQRQQTTCPLLIPAVLHRNGLLEAAKTENLPWIPRYLLEPSNSDLILGKIDDFHDYLADYTLNIEENSSNSWQELFTYAWAMFEAVAGQEWRETFADARFRISDRAAIVPISSMRGLSNNILKVYEALQDGAKFPPLLAAYCRLHPNKPQNPIEPTDWSRPSKRHLGSINDSFPLSPSQREALYHFLMSPEKSVLAISGPPGTGKTTLLHSVIASLWVSAAIEENDPPVIVASSTNNQAVTNVIDSLSSIKDLERWIQVPTLGLYLVNSEDKQKEARARGIQFANRWDNGFPEQIENKDFVNLARLEFLAACSEHFGQPMHSLERAIQALRRELLSTYAALVKGIDISFNTCKLQIQAREITEGYESFDAKASEIEMHLQAAKGEVAHWQAISNAWTAYQPVKPNILYRLLFRSRMKRETQESRAAFLAELFPDLVLETKDDHYIALYIAKELKRAQAKARSVQTELNGIEQLKREIAKVKTTWHSWRQQQNAQMLEMDQLFVPERPDGSANTACLLNWLDTSLRHRLFVQATHYWEGRWLQTVINEGVADSDYRDLQRRKSQEEKWHRYAMLTPCFVTTMHSGPSFFDYYHNGQAHPLLGFIDLLIIDEAGQVTPEVSGGMFALAKQALVVGDIKQIEPIWSVPQQIDEANLQTTGLLNGNQDRKRVLNRGLMASSGSVMQMAQSVSPYQLPASDGVQYERGMFLAEHRRCVPEVIGYCNELAYQGRLRPMRPSIEEYPWPHIGYAHIKGNSAKAGVSRNNLREAEALVGWVVANRDALETHYEKNLDEILGIITPFAAQKRTFWRLLEQEGIRLSKVGTVHALQGGERPVVLFSTVYSQGDTGRYFFDRGPNMLNVAVSRAKDCFLVFGDMEILDPYLNSPSGILARYLFADEQNEITDFPLSTRTGKGLDGKEVHLINTLPKHVATLARAFERAEERLVIVSPYLRSRAVEADNLPQKVNDAVRNGVEVTIYVDDGFNNQLQLPSAAQAASKLQDSGATIKVCHNIHSKIICIDDQIFIEGSFNWLSAERIRDDYTRHETSMIYIGAQAPDFIEDTVQHIDSTVISKE